MAKDILPPDVIEALRGGNKIEAIKRLRGKTGLGLKEAKDWVDSYERGATSLQAEEEPAPAPLSATAALTKEATEALRRGDMMGAIKVIRASGMSLADVKSLLESLQKQMPQGRAAESRKTGLEQPPRPGPGLAPGEVARAGSPGKWLALVVVGVVAVLVVAFFA